jgi:hypothetical protein
MAETESASKPNTVTSSQGISRLHARVLRWSYVAVVAGFEDSQGIARQSRRRAVVNRGCDGGGENLEDVLVAEQRRDMFVAH